MKSALAEGELEGRLRDQTIKRMKEKGGLAYYFRIRSTLKIREEAFEPGKTVRVYLPIPLEYAQVRNFRLLHTSMEPLTWFSHTEGASQDSAASVAAEDGMF